MNFKKKFSAISNYINHGKSMIKNKSKNIFTFYLFTFVIIFTIPFLIFSVSMYSVVANSFKTQLIENEITTLTNIEYSFQNSRNKYLEVATKLAKNYVHFNIYSESNASIDYDVYYHFIENQSNILSAYPEISNIYLYNHTNGNFIVNNSFEDFNNFYDTDWYDSIDKQSFQPQWLYNRNSAYDTLIYPYSSDIYVAVNISIDDMYANLFANTDDYTFVVNNANDKTLWKNNLLTPTLQQLNKDSIKLENNKYYVIQRQSVIAGRTLITLKSANEFFKPLRVVVYIITIISMFLFLLILSICIFAADKFSMPIRNLASNIEYDNDAMNELDALNEYITSVNENNSYLKHRLALNDINLSESNILKFLRNIPINPTQNNIDTIFTPEIKCFTIATIKFNSDIKPNIIQNYAVNITRMLDNFIDTIRYFLLYIDSETIAILFFSTADRTEHNRAILTFTKMLTNSQELSPVIAISNTVSSKEQLHDEFLRSLELLKHRLYSKGYVIQDVDCSYSPTLECQKQETAFLSAISKHDFAKTDKTLSDIIEYIKAIKPYPDIVISYFNMLYQKIQNIPMSHGFSDNELIFRTQNNYKFMINYNLDDIYEYFINYANNIIAGLNVKMSAQNSDLIQNIKQYIHENIESDISLTTVSDYYGITPQYLSTMFKQETGQNFIKFLSAAKIEYAKELLTGTTMSVKDIANTIGYNDHSFFTMFKKQVGITPREYRNLHTH